MLDLKKVILPDELVLPDVRHLPPANVAGGPLHLHPHTQTPLKRRHRFEMRQIALR